MEKLKQYHCFPHFLCWEAVTLAAVYHLRQRYRATTFTIKWFINSPESTPEEPTRDNRRPNGKRWVIKKIDIKIVHLFLVYLFGCDELITKGFKQRQQFLQLQFAFVFAEILG